MSSNPTSSPHKTIEQIAIAAATAGIHYPYISPVVQAQVQAAAAAAAAAAASAAAIASPAKTSASAATAAVAPFQRHVASNVPTPKGSPMRRAIIAQNNGNQHQNNVTSSGSAQGSPKRQPTGEEQWVDGPRLSKTKVAEARHLLREINHVKQKEQWIDGPKSAHASPAKMPVPVVQQQAKPAVSQATTSTAAPVVLTAPLIIGSLPGANTSSTTYGYMDSHKKTMIRQWVENQTSQIFQPSGLHTQTVIDSQPTSTPTQFGSPSHSSKHAIHANHHGNHGHHSHHTHQQYQINQHQHQPQHHHHQQQPIATNPLRGGQFTSTAVGVDDSELHSIASSHHTGDALLGHHQHHQSNQLQNQYQHHQKLQSTAATSTTTTTAPLPGFAVRLGGLSQQTSTAAAADQPRSIASASHRSGDDDEAGEDQDSGPSEVPPALPLIEPLSSREISHDSIHRICSRRVSHESLSQLHVQTKDCGLQVTEDDIVRAMG